MWPFTKQKRVRDKEAVDSSLEARVAALEQTVRTIDHEWTEWYEKFRRLHMRLAKRERDAEREADPSIPMTGAALNGRPPGRGINPLAAAILSGTKRGE